MLHPSLVELPELPQMHPRDRHLILHRGCSSLSLRLLLKTELRKGTCRVFNILNQVSRLASSHIAGPFSPGVSTFRTNSGTSLTLRRALPSSRTTSGSCGSST